MPGVYEITDENGNVVGTVGTDASGNPTVSKSGGGTVTITDDGLETDSVSTGDLSYDGSLPFTLNLLDYSGWGELIQDIPNISLGHGDTISLRVEVPDNATYTISETLRESHLGEIQVLGNRTTPGDRPTVTAQSGEPALSVESSKTRIGGVDFTEGGNGGSSAVFVGTGASVELRDTTITGGFSDWSIDALRANRLSINDSVTVTGPGKGTAEGVRVHSTNNASVRGTIQDFNTGLFVDRGGTVDGLGDLSFNNLTFAIVAQDGADVKSVNGSGTVSYNNCDYAALATKEAFVQLGEGIDYTDVGQMYRLNGGTVECPDAKDPVNQTTSHIYHGNGWITQPGPFSGSWIVCFAPPGFPVRGQMAIADGNDWNPLGNGNAGIVGYTGSNWQTIHDYGGPFGAV